MKKVAIALFVMCALFSLKTDLFGCEEGKHYIKQESIVVQDDGIFLHVGEDWVPINTLYADANGLYLKEAKWPWTPFKCASCEHFNPAYLVVCEKCGKPRDNS
jgi:hypothetical protein